MSARIFAHPTVTLEVIHRLYREHGLVAVSRPARMRARPALRVELRPLVPPPWSTVEARR
ncbi:MAG: hypothetical protein WCS09_02935 [Pseudomonadota bacterium]